jgi:hypothetical protein
MNIARRRFFSLAASSIAAGALSVVAARSAWAQAVDEGAEFVPGQILVGVDTPGDRDPLAQKLEQDRPRFRTGNDNLAGLSVEKSGRSSLRLKVEFSDTVKGRLSSDPNAELGLLEDLANQIRANNPNVRYAHPNWVVRVDPVEQVLLQDIP